MGEEELPKQLKKLEIGSLLPHFKVIDSQLPLPLNPFYAETKTDLPGANAFKINFGDIKCSCRLRRRSESVLDDCKPTVISAPTSRIEHTIRKLPQFKHKNRKKNILREPVLKSLQRCTLHKFFKDYSGSISSSAGETKSTIEALNLDDTINKLKISSEDGPTIHPKSNSTGITDFRDLIAECQNLLEINCNVKNSSRKRLKNSSVIQSRQKHGTSEQKDTSNREDVGVRPSGSNSTRTSCSQQARINAVATTNRSSTTGATPPCDVTIDELASYFETFVHIPKKMSTMAEMMYI